MFRSHGYIPSGNLICVDGTSLNLAELPRFLRTLLVADGTVTKTLEAYYWEGIKIDPLHQSSIVLEEPLPELCADVAEPVLKREVLLKGEASGNEYAFARSFLRLESLSLELREGLETGVIGIGELLREQGIETYREIISIEYFAEAPEDDAQLQCLTFPVVARSYRIRASGTPAFLVTEYFSIPFYEAS